MRARCFPPMLVVLALVPVSAEASVYGVPCRDSATNRVVLRVKPRNCTLGGQFGYQQAPIRKIRWRSWGGRSSYGRGVLIVNMGFRAPVRFRLYWLDHHEEDFFVYRRARGTTFARDGPIKWTMRLPLS
jgi:hypothetical protein